MTSEPRTERRLTTILAADVAGYSRLTGTEGSLSAMEEESHRMERTL